MVDLLALDQVLPIETQRLTHVPPDAYEMGPLACPELKMPLTWEVTVNVNHLCI